MPVKKTLADRRGKQIFAVVVVIVGLIAGALIVSKILEIDLDPVTSCMVEKRGGVALRPVKQTIILIDQSEKIPDPQKALIRKYVARLLADELKQNERLMLFTFSLEQIGILQPKIDLCKPKESANQITETQWKLGAQLLQKFYLPVLAALSPALDEVVGRESPIMEAIQGVTPHVHPWKETKKLIIISDLLQHTPQKYSHYRMLPQDEFNLLINKQGKLRTLASLQGWSIKILYISRRDQKGTPIPFQDANHLKFWHEYFQAAGVSSIEFERI